MSATEITTVIANNMSRIAADLPQIATNIKRIIADIDNELILTTEKYNKYKGNYYSIIYQKQIDECIGIILNIEICNYNSEDFISIWCDTCIIADNHYYPISNKYNELSANELSADNYNVLEDSIKEVYNTVKANCESVYGDYIKNEQKYFKRFKL